VKKSPISLRIIKDWKKTQRSSQVATDNSNKKETSENVNPSQFSSRQSPVYEDAMSKEKLSRKQKYENLQKKYKENLTEKRPGGNSTNL